MKLLCPELYPSQWQHKRDAFLRQFQEQHSDSLGIDEYCSEPVNYRARMEFNMRRLKSPAPGRWRYSMFDGQSPYYQGESQVPLRPIQERMPHLLRFLGANEEFAKGLFQSNWRANTEGVVLLSLIYHRNLSEESPEGRAWLRTALDLENELDLKLIGRARKKVLCPSGKPHLDSLLELGGGLSLRMRQSDTCFSQPNAYTNLAMLNWARQHFRPEASNLEPQDLLELYCGIGNFTCALAGNFSKVLATEVVRESIDYCHHNLAANQLHNVQIARLSAAETAQALDRQREFHRLASINLDSYKFTHLLIDPPRQGLDSESRDFTARFSNVLYVSCNPQALLPDLKAWEGRYKIHRMALFDQFPYTEHLEVAVILQAKD